VIKLEPSNYIEKPILLTLAGLNSKVSKDLVRNLQSSLASLSVLILASDH